MARYTKALTVKELEAKANTIGDHTAGGVDGRLILRVRKTSAGNLSRSWAFVTRKNGKLKTFGLGAYTAQCRSGAMTVAQARKEASRIIDDIRNGRNPREEVQPAVGEEAPKVIKDLFEEFIRENSERVPPKWTNTNTPKNYVRTFKKLIEPQIGNLTPNDVTPEMLASFLCPAMAVKHSTGKRMQHILSAFFRWCIGKGIRSMALGNPAKSEALKDLLPKEEQCPPEEHRTTCPLSDLQRFFQLAVSGGRLDSARTMAILFTILTCSRLSNVARSQVAERVTYAEWKDIDLGESGREMWRIPAQKMKERTNGDHLVPLSTQAVAILQRLQKLGMADNKGGIFIGSYGSVVTRGVCNAAILRFAEIDKKAGGSGFIDPQSGKIMTIHGAARASFQLWAAARPNLNVNLVEKALHHSLGKIRSVYMRGNLAEERRQLMQEWADFLFAKCPKDWAEVKAA